MQNDPLVEWQRLTETYSKMYDGELLELAAATDDLTEQARQVLSDEIRKRGLDSQPDSRSDSRFAASAPHEVTDPMIARAAVAFGVPSRVPEPVPDQAETGEETDGPHEYTWKTLLCECESAEEGRQLAEMLRRAGIESWIEGPRGSYSPYSQLDQRTPRILVPADRLEEARQIAARPIPNEIVVQSQMQVPEYELPVCPKCGAGDPVLEGVDPFNSWLCEACGNEWTESAVDDEKEEK
jgi:hypothetical protein